MKALPLKKNPNGNGYIQCEVHDATHVQLKFPLKFKPLQDRYIPIQLSGSRENTYNWSWNGDTENPTLRPSILTEFPWGEDRTMHRCHSFVNDGKVQFLSDCSHEIAGQTVELLEVIHGEYKVVI